MPANVISVDARSVHWVGNQGRKNCQHCNAVGTIIIPGRDLRTLIKAEKRTTTHAIVTADLKKLRSIPP